MQEDTIKRLLKSFLIFIRSTSLQVMPFETGVEYYFGYFSIISLRLEEDPIRNYRNLQVDSKWYELENGEDNFELNLTLENSLYRSGDLEQLDDSFPLQKYPGRYYFPFYGNYVQKIERYSFRFLYQERAPTKHILLFYFSNGTRMLLKPDFSGMGLFLALDEPRIQAFFDGPQKDQIILIDTFE